VDDQREDQQRTSRPLNSGSVRSAMAAEAVLPSGCRHTTASSCHSTGTPSLVTCGAAGGLLASPAQSNEGPQHDAQLCSAILLIPLTTASLIDVIMSN
jgi:hypothetical protein